MKIDIYSHFCPERYLKALKSKSIKTCNIPQMNVRPNCEIEIRLRYMEMYPDVLQVLTLTSPALEAIVSTQDAIELAEIANDELAELVIKYPDRFLTAVACLPMNDINAALDETDRAITQLGLRGIQIYTSINGEPLSLPKFKPLWEKMVNYDLPIWMHPIHRYSREESRRHPFDLDCQIAEAMVELVSTGIFDDYPNIKFINHHCGGILPMEYAVVRNPIISGERQILNPLEHFRKFYVDTSVCGSIGSLMCGWYFFGPEKMLFGTDAPLSAFSQAELLTKWTIGSIEKMNVPNDDKTNIFENNALKILRLAT